MPGEGSGLNKAVTALRLIDAVNAPHNANAGLDRGQHWLAKRYSSSRSISIANGGSLVAGGGITLDAGRTINTESTQT